MFKPRKRKLQLQIKKDICVFFWIYWDGNFNSEYVFLSSGSITCYKYNIVTLKGGDDEVEMQQHWIKTSFWKLMLSLSLSFRSLQRNHLQKLKANTFSKYQSLQKLWVYHELWITYKHTPWILYIVIYLLHFILLLTFLVSLLSMSEKPNRSI